MAARKKRDTGGVDPAELERVKKLVREHEDNGRTDTYWHGILTRLEAAQTPAEPETEPPETIEETEQNSEVNNGSSD